MEYNSHNTKILSVDEIVKLLLDQEFKARGNCMHKMKVMTVVGTRPEIIKLSQIIKKLDKEFDHTLVHTGQNYDYELNEIFFKELKLRKPDIFLNAAGKTSSQTTGNVISKIEPPLLEKNPEAFSYSWGYK